MSRTRARGRFGRRARRALLPQAVGPDVRVAALVARDVPERRGAARVLLDRRERVVEGDRVLLELQVVEALRDVPDASLAVVTHPS